MMPQNPVTSKLRRRKLLAAVAALILMWASARPVRATDWVTTTPQDGGLDPVPLAALTKAVENGAFPNTTSVLIIYRGKLVFEKYFGAGNVNLLNDTRSAMKAVTGLAMGMAIHDGAIAGVDAPAFLYLRDMAPFRNDTRLKREITVEDLLTMSSALECNDDVDSSVGNEDRMHEQSVWTRWAVDLPTQAAYSRDASGRGPFTYCTANAFLAGQVVQRAVHRPVDEYVAEKLFTPLGIEAWEWPHSPTGEVMTGGGLRLRSRDIAKVAWMEVNDGTWNGRRIVPADWIGATMTPHRIASPEQTYGYLSYQRRYTGCDNIEAGMMAGNGGSVVLMLRPQRAAVVITRQNYNVHGTARQTTDMVERYILPALPCGALLK